MSHVRKCVVTVITYVALSFFGVTKLQGNGVLLIGAELVNSEQIE